MIERERSHIRPDGPNVTVGNRSPRGAFDPSQASKHIQRRELVDHGETGFDAVQVPLDLDDLYPKLLDLGLVGLDPHGKGLALSRLPLARDALPVDEGVDLPYEVIEDLILQSQEPPFEHAQRATDETPPRRRQFLPQGDPIRDQRKARAHDRPLVHTSATSPGDALLKVGNDLLDVDPTR
jgi:hypothetical protein